MHKSKKTGKNLDETIGKYLNNKYVMDVNTTGLYARRNGMWVKVELKA